MKKSQTALSFLGIVFTCILVVVAVLKIWVPEMIEDGVFVKVILTFAAMTLGSLVIQFIKSLSDEKAEAQAQQPSEE